MIRVFTLAAAALLAVPATAAESLAGIQSSYDAANFMLTGKAQVAAFEQLQADAEAYTDAHPNDAAGWAWRGIIDSSFAGAKGGLGALGLAKQSRKHFEASLGIDDTVMDGAAYTSLGVLYYSVPGWPVGFGDDDKADELLQKGLRLSPNGIESNYFYAEFQAEQGNTDQALTYYRKALAAPDRPGRQVADEARRQQAQAGIDTLMTR